MKKALFISYYWPPSRSAGAQRVYKLCKYLPRSGYEVDVVAGTESPESAAPPSGTRLERVPFWFDPVRWTTRGGGRGGAAAPAGAGRAAWKKIQQFLWLNLFVPDSRIGWYRPARRRIDALLGRGDFQVVVSTAPPYTAHLLGRYVRERYGIPWVADMRDPWIENHAYNRGVRLGFVRRLNGRLERSVFAAADRIVCVMESQRELFAGKVPAGEEDKISVVRNGYDAEDLTGPWEPSKRFLLSYLGTSYEDGFPYRFFDVLSDLAGEGGDLSKDLLLRIVGTTPPAVAEYVRSRFPPDRLQITAPVPHGEFTRLLRDQQVLILIVNEGRLHEYSLPSKLYEYLPSENPILAVGPAGHEASRIVAETGRGGYFSAGQSSDIRRFVLGCYERWRSGGGRRPPREFPEYERSAQAERFAAIMDGAAESGGRSREATEGAPE